jgi:tetratricopeptide (TPR) repeat protein
MEVEKSHEDKVSEQKQIQAQLDDLQRSNRTLHEQVDILQIESKEHERPWFKNPSIIVSLLAVLVTVTLTSYNISEQNKDKTEKSIKEKQSNVRVAIKNLVEAQKENIKITQIINANERNQLDTLINSQRQVLIEDAKAMVDDLGDNASTNSLLFLGFELEKDSNFEIALSYYERAFVSAGDDISDQVIALRSLANIRMRPNTGFYDYEKGQIHWQQAVDIQKDQKDEYSLYKRGETYINWSYAENLLGNKEIAIKILSQTESIFKLMDIRNPMRERAFQSTSNAREYFLNPKASFSTTQLVGKWKLEYFNNTSPSGNIQITLNPNNGALDVTGEFIDRSGIIVQTFRGEGIFIGPENLKINWGGARKTGNRFEIIQGNMTLKRIDNNKLEGTESILGKTINKVTFTRHLHETGTSTASLIGVQP